LTLISTVPVETETAYLATDRTCRFLVGAAWGNGHVSVHTIGAAGILGPGQHQSLATSRDAHSVVFDAENRHVLVPHTIGCIHSLSFEAASGTLAHEAAPWVAPSGTGPRHLVFHPTRDLAYVVNEGAHNVTALEFDRNTGALNPCQTLSTIPEGYHGHNACAEVRVHPTGRFLYVSNRGHDSIACFRIDEANGRLCLLGHVVTERMPWSFDFDPQGRFLYVAGRDWGRLSAYRVDEASGTLKRVAIYEVGAEPRWVRTVRLYD
jgi:6-phosphogluconolactonase